MRIAIALAAACALAVPALAQTRGKPAAQAKPAPKADPLAQSYAALPEADRIAIQTDLIWTGDYNGVATPEFGARAITAVKAFQKRLRAKETGVLNPKERGQLAAAAKTRREAAGWRVVTDSATGMRLGLPFKFLTQHTLIAGGSRWSSARGETQIETFRIATPGTSLQAIYEGHRKLPDRKISYNVVRGDWFVVAGLQSGVKKFYVRGQFKDGEVRGFSVAYDQALEGSLDHVVIAMASATQAFPAGVAAAPPPRRKVEYGTAVVISGDGYALTTRELVESCQVITLTGYGPADRVAADGDSGLALLRVYGVGNLKPAAISAATAPTEATLVGIADPERQGGGHAPSVATARFTKSDVADRPAIVPVPGLGFAGAPAVDRQGHVLGLADVTTRVVAGPPVASAPHATLIPGSAIKAFLAQHKVAAGATASSSVEGVKGSVARVICWRK